jgi:preprotein translocase subunit SecG
VELVCLFIVLALVYVLGENAGRQNPSRNDKVQEIVKLEAELKNRKSDLYANYTHPVVVVIVICLVILFIVMLFGGGHDAGHYRRFR